jgi:hypothetical protein
MVGDGLFRVARSVVRRVTRIECLTAQPKRSASLTFTWVKFGDVSRSVV